MERGVDGFLGFPCNTNTSAALENASDVSGSWEGWQPEAIIVPVLFALIFLVGTVGNSLVLAVLLRGDQMNSTTNLFILNLGVADLCFIICCVPFQATIYTLDGWVFGALLCKAVHFLIFLTMYASSFTLATVSLDRYLAIRYPLHSRELRTPRNGLVAIGLIWTLALIFSGPYLSYYSQSELDNLTVCHPAWSAQRRRTMDVCTFVFSYLLPVLVLSLTYIRTLRYLWRTVDPVATLSVSKRSKRKVTRMIVIVATLFCLCWLPHHALILSVWFGHFPLTRANYVLRILSHLVSYANSCVNPIVYALVSKHFRKGFRKICEGLLCRAPQLVSHRVRVAPSSSCQGNLLVHDSVAMIPVCKVTDPTILVPEHPLRDSVLNPLPGPSWRVESEGSLYPVPPLQCDKN